MTKSDRDFIAGELVMAMDSGKPYEARIINIMDCNGTTKYFIHFNGWNKKWDKWVDNASLLKVDANSKDNKKRARVARGSSVDVISSVKEELVVEKVWI